MKVAWLIQNLVSYHHARFATFSDLDGIEGHLLQVTDKDAFGVLEFEAETRPYALHTLFEGRTRTSIPAGELRAALSGVLSAIQPDCVCASGWGMEIGWLMQEWGLANRVPVVMLSESTAFDEPRKRHKEWIKSVLVKACRAALVGGTPHKEYIRQLGMPEEAIHLGHNAVNSGHFEQRVHNRPASLPEWLGNEPYFLCCTRFGQKKNIPRLVHAYARHLRASEGQVPKLAIAGDGELRGEIEQAISGEGLAGQVVLLGAATYSELPWLYQNCHAFIHASTTEQWGLVVNEAMASGVPVLVSERCGCSFDLVQDGINGFRFDPFDEEAIAGALSRISALSEAERRAMGHAGKKIIAAWGPERFAAGLRAAVEATVGTGKRSGGMAARALLRLLPHRGEG
jgi:glycosyltransferase involved in cell wall biosynthesis